MTMTTATLETIEVEVPPTLGVQVHARSSTDPEAISQAMGSAFATLGEYLRRNALAPSGPPRAIYTNWSPAETEFTVAFPVRGVPAHPRDDDAVSIEPLPSGRALRVVHRGPYDGLRATYGEIDAWLRSRGAIQSEADWNRYMPMWEEYLNDPTTTAPEDLITRIFLPLRES
jgi:effector-binding domain-containing protein